MHRRTLEAREKVLGRQRPHTLSSTNNLGWVLSNQGKYEDAEAMHRRDLEGYEQVLGCEHPYTLISVSNLSSVLDGQGKYEEAEAMHQWPSWINTPIVTQFHNSQPASIAFGSVSYADRGCGDCSASLAGSTLMRKGKYCITITNVLPTQALQAPGLSSSAPLEETIASSVDFPAIHILGLLDVAVREYSSWQQSGLGDEALKAEVRKACDVALDDGLDLAQIDLYYRSWLYSSYISTPKGSLFSSIDWTPRIQRNYSCKVPIYQPEISLTNLRATELQSNPERQYQRDNLLQTWMISYYKIQKRDPHAAKLLLLLAYFDNRGIWYELIKSSHYSSDVPVWLERTISSGLAFRTGVKNLIGFSLLRIKEQVGGYTIHPVVQDWCIHHSSTDTNIDSTLLYELTLIAVGYSVPSLSDRNYSELQ
ncbi:uncharacterized protein N7496_012333 [Penicillium cataractarum]|uniref:Uncharacterized protein n=1 Tax=Penicillium cataractarum TaxID=2100454 RepID=A0A9W9UUE8_9EURO|nr:uncharacterized protein N7496_012333 [Penicillium cataractarum]KAJ5355121.1 hypothetical protein N7496_012333 [Penicillium cataractarum]